MEFAELVVRQASVLPKEPESLKAFIETHKELGGKGMMGALSSRFVSLAVVDVI